MTLIKLDDVTLQFPRIFEPTNFGENEAYTLALEVDRDQQQQMLSFGIAYNDKHQVINCRSNFKPLLTEKNGMYEQLGNLIAITKMRNISLDRLLIGATADVLVDTYEFKNEFKSGTGLHLREVILNVEELYEAMEDYVEKVRS